MNLYPATTSTESVSVRVMDDGKTLSITFGTTCAFITMTVDEARDLAVKLQNAAVQVAAFVPMEHAA